MASCTGASEQEAVSRNGKGGRRAKAGGRPAPTNPPPAPTNLDAAVDVVETLGRALAGAEGLVGVVDVAGQQVGRVGVGARDEHGGCARHVGRQARRHQVAHRLLRGHQHLATQVAALLLRRQLVLTVDWRRREERGGEEQGGERGETRGMAAAGTPQRAALESRGAGTTRRQSESAQAQGAGRPGRRAQLTAGSTRLNQVPGQLVGVEGAAKARLCVRVERAGVARECECRRAAGGGTAGPDLNALRRLRLQRQTLPPPSSPPRTRIRHDGQEVVARHLALYVLNLVRALQGLRGAGRGRRGG